MSNPNKQQGTQWEQDNIHAATTPDSKPGPSPPRTLRPRRPSMGHPQRRPCDRGSRCRQQMNAHTELDKAIGQVGKADLPFAPWMTVISWKRLALKTGGRRRSRVGEPVVVIRRADFLTLLGSGGK